MQVIDIEEGGARGEVQNVLHARVQNTRDFEQLHYVDTDADVGTKAETSARSSMGCRVDYNNKLCCAFIFVIVGFATTLYILDNCATYMCT
jgi:hypothetical protein